MRYYIRISITDKRDTITLESSTQRIQATKENVVNNEALGVLK